MTINNKIVFIDNQKGLEDLASIIPKQEIIYFDMEVDNMHHYYNEVSLIQLLIGETCYIVDALSEVTMEPLLESLKDSTLIIHGSDFDLRTLFQHYQFVPKKLFDTMIAARLIGLHEFGLGSLVKHFFDVTLNKQYQKANWSTRPLIPEMVEYAAVDTFYLPGLFEILTKKLEAQNRLAWHSEYCEYLKTQTQIIKEIDNEKVWRIKGSSKLSPRQLQGLKTLWYWRDNTAKNKNWPPFKVMNADSMIGLVSSLPENKGEKVDYHKLHLRTHTSLKADLISSLQEGLAVSPEQWPAKKAFGKPRTKPKNPQLIESMKGIRDDIAEKLALNPSLIINKDSIVAIAETGVTDKKAMEEAALLMNWQRDLLFDKWLAAHS